MTVQEMAQTLGLKILAGEEGLEKVIKEVTHRIY